MDAKQIKIVSQSYVYAVAFANESQVLGGDRNGDIRRWNIEDGQQEGPTMRGSGGIRSIAISKDGQWIASGDRGKKATVWNAATHEKVGESTGYEGSVTAVDISSNCGKVVAASWGGNVRMFGTNSDTQLLPPLSRSYIVGVRFSPDGSRFATASNDCGVRVYSTCDGNVLFDSGRRGPSYASTLVTPLAWSSDGQQLFVASKGKITCFDVSRSSSSEWSTHETLSQASIASNGRFIACSAGSSVSLWDCVSHKQIGSIITHNTDIDCIALSPSGGYLACGVRESIIVHNLRDILPLKYFVSSPRAPQLPFVQVSVETLKSWTQGDPTKTETLLSEEIMSTASPSHYLLANRALIRAHSEHLAPAIEDCKESLRIHPSPIGYIAMAVALLGQGDREGALRAFDLAFHDCESHDHRLLLLLKSILVFESGNEEDAITRVKDLTDRANDDDAIYLYTQVLGVMYMKKGNYKHAIALMERAKYLAPKDKRCPLLMTISLIFRWSFNELDIVAQQRLCESFYAKGCTVRAVEILLDIVRTPDKETQESQDWIADFTKKCATTLERVGDEVYGLERYDDAITQYSAALSLGPPSLVGLLLKRSRAQAAKELWKEALQDATEAVKSDPSNPWGYEAKHVAFHGAKQYDEAIAAFNSMLHAIEQSQDPAIKDLRKNYTSPSETTAAIDSIIRGVLKNCPLAVIDVITGCLCDGPERMSIFKADPSFKELVSSMTREMDVERIQRVVTSFFRYVMFSHAWQGNEPSFQEVNIVKSVWNLPNMPFSEKLQNLCKETRRLGYKWAWSDTCCIDKATGPILHQSLTSMYKWYADSAATLVFLAGVAHPSKPGDLTQSLWMTRAWTLQELLAPKIIFFYDSKWKPYLGITGTNHKECPEIMQELADAVKIPRGTIIMFSPDDLGVREKLRLASTRHATMEEDVAYSLIGIFKSDIRPHYGEGANALGHLLEEIVARFGEVTVLAWSGKSSSYNSCLPDCISVYNQALYSPPSLEGEELNTRIMQLRGKLSKQETLCIYKQINSLQPARFAARRLYLPCIVFPVRALSIQGDHRGDEKLYHAEVSGLGNVEFTTTDDLTPGKQKKLVFAHPWIRHIRGPSSGVTGENDLESDTDSDSDGSAGLDEDTSSHAVAVPLAGGYARALQMIARLGQPFNALLLVQQPNGEYKRVAAENEIVVPGLGTDITPKNIRARVLEIL